MNKLLKKLILFFTDKLFLYYKNQDKIKLEKKKQKLLSQFHSAGYNVKINGKIQYISSPTDVIIGNNVHIGNNCYLKTEGGLIIGSNTHISRNLTIYTVNHDYEGMALPYDSTLKYKPVIIGNNVWIGMNVSIMPGFCIGDGAIIGLGTVINRDIEKCEIVGPALASTIKYRDKYHYSDLNSNLKFGGVNGELLSKNGIKNYFPTYLSNKDKPIVFILSTGRSGSLSIANILNQHPDCKAFHEDISQLIKLSTELANDPKNKKLIFELLAIFNTKTWNAGTDELIVHSDLKLWNLIPLLHDYFPNAKFIHLIREPISCVKSMVVRDWYKHNEFPLYNNHKWAQYRVKGDEVGFFSAEKWQSLTNVQKCVWYYFYVNSQIKKQLNLISKEKVLLVKLEELNIEIKSIQKFLNLRQYDLRVITSNKVKYENVSNLKKISSEEIDNEIQNMLHEYNFDI